MKTTTLLLLAFLSFTQQMTLAQTPFTASVREPILLVKTENPDGTKRLVEINDRSIITSVNGIRNNHFISENHKILKLKDSIKKLDKLLRIESDSIFRKIIKKKNETLISEIKNIEKNMLLGEKSNELALLDTTKVKRIKKELASLYIQPEKNVAPDFFGNNSISASLLGRGETRLSAIAQVIHYKLYMANPNESNTFRHHRYNLPLFIITKLSTSYDSMNSSTAIDVLDYEGAPITIRAMPSWGIKLTNYSDIFYLGFYTDLRGLNLLDPISNEYNIEVLGSGGFGFTYQADGKAGSYEPNGEYADGRYSISLMLQGAIGDNKVIRRLFKSTRDVVSSIQGYFLFSVKEDSPLNIKVGYQYFFDEMLSGDRTNFSIALGFTPKK